MLCQRCKSRQATVEYAESVGGKKFEVRLCAECYAELYGELNSKANADLWAGLFGAPDRPQKVCPVCGTTYNYYRKTGLLGCASCYDVFKEELMPAIERIQGKTYHVGKVGTNVDEYGLHRRLKSLQEQLEQALREKRYDDAGRLNMRIKEITRALYGGGGGGNG